MPFTMHQLIAVLEAAALLAVLLVVGYGIPRYLLPYLRRKGAADVWIKGFDALGAVARTVVAHIEMRFVGPLKSPTQAGTWTPEAAEQAKQAAMTEIRQLGWHAIQALQSSGESASNVTALIDRLVETSVLDLKARGAAVATPAPSNGVHVATPPAAPTTPPDRAS